MEKNIPGLDREFKLQLAKIRADKPSLEAAKCELAVWSAKYAERVVEGDSMFPGEGTYGSILEAYARREALKQYIEEVTANGNRNRSV